MENFPQASVRHWRDAEVLERESRFDNADHHYGLAAECALKTAMVGLPVFVTGGRLDKEHRLHVDQLWSKVRLLRLHKDHPELYALLGSKNPFASWKVDQRYAATGVVPAKEMASHKEAAKRVLGCVRLLGRRSA